MGAACVRPRVVEWESLEMGKQDGWTSASKLAGNADTESKSPKLIRAVHANQAPDATAFVELKTAQSLKPDERERELINWAAGDCIGQGAFGKVVLGLNVVTGELMAVKQIRLSNEQSVAAPVAEHVRKVEAEVDVLKQLHHTNIVRYLGTEKTTEHLNIFLEYVPGGSIASLISKFGRFNESVIKIYTRQILLGLDYLHGNGIMHRDIKGANILVDNTGLVKLADFGASKKIESLATIDSGMKQSIKGTPHWMAPEVIHQKGVGRAADIWSVACTVIEMATGKPPWSHITSQVSVMLHIAQTHGPPPLPETLSTACRDFLRLCFNRSPRDRPNAVRLLQHPFLEGVACPSVTASPLTNISTAPLVPKGLADMEVPSPVQEESGTPTSRGTGTTTSSSSNRRQETHDDMSRFSPMGAAVRHSQISGLTPVQEASFEAVSSSNPDGLGSKAHDHPLILNLPENTRFKCSLETVNPVAESCKGTLRSPLQARSPNREREKPGWPLMPIGSPVRLQNTEVGMYIEREASEEHILQWVRSKARTDTARLSQSFKSLSLRRPGSVEYDREGPEQLCGPDLLQECAGDVEKRAQWEAELEQELSRQRWEQKRGNPVVRCLDTPPVRF